MHSSDTSLITHLSIIKDPRIDRTKKHNLIDILVMAICAVIANCEGWEEVEWFAEARQDWFKTFLELPNDIPSHDTFARVFARIDPAHLQQALTEWLVAMKIETKGKVVAIDGKTVRRSFDKATQKASLHLVSAWLSEDNLILGQTKVDSKSNEIKAIPKLLEMLHLKGAIVTTDALGCQKSIVKDILAKDAEYVLAVKKNQPELFENVEFLFNKAQKDKSLIFQTHQTVDSGHGRIETRTYSTIAKADLLQGIEGWKKLSAVGMAESVREIGDTVSLEKRYYIMSFGGNAKEFGKAVREHWGIENSVHWILDVTFGEDLCRIRKDNSAENLAMLRRIALNCVRQEPTKTSMKRKRKLASWNTDFLVKLLTGN
ncbi:MAG: ISAs1 family transposase [Proteobacteria bacterium]|nr:ISAs1 family transposase [Pseudomonadota bacterium]